MSTATLSIWPNFGRRAGRISVVALAGSVLLAVLAPEVAVRAYRFAAFACLQPALGSLIFLLIFRITGGQWGESLLPFFRAGVRLLPWIWPLIAPLALMPIPHPGFRDFDAAIPANPPAMVLLLRAAAYELIFLALRRVALRETGRNLAAPGLLALVFTLHFLAADWFFTLEPGWYSSGFPLVWMSLQAGAGLALAIVATAAAGRGADEEGSAGRPLGHDWGDLILTTVIFSSYVAFVQFLIIWSGNLPREIAWYLRRGTGGWKVLIAAVAVFHLAFPVAFMLFRPVKRSRTWMPRVAALVFGAEAVWAAWMILPAFGDRGALFPVACVLGLAAGAGLLAPRYLSSLLSGKELP